MARPYRITYTVVVDREAFDADAARNQAIEAARQIREGVGGRVVGVDVVSIEPAERRGGADRRQAESP